MTAPDVYELLDLGIGQVPDGRGREKRTFGRTADRALRVATKFPRHCTQAITPRLSREIEIIKLNGSIELAPLLGLSDVIVDIVETGTTLKENESATCWKPSFRYQRPAYRQSRPAINLSTGDLNGQCLEKLRKEG